MKEKNLLISNYQQTFYNIFHMKNITKLFLAASLFTSAAIFCQDISAQRTINLNSLRKASESGLMAMPGNNSISHRFNAPVRTADENQHTRVIVDEDFSAWTKGSEAEPDTINVVSSANPYIDNSLTKQPGWSGFYLYQAGGLVAITSSNGGAINTPIGDYSGDLTITFRAKAISKETAIIVNVARGDIWDPMTAGSPTECSKTFNLTAEEGWKDFTFKFKNYYSDNDGFVQINIPYRKALLDDIKVISEMTDFIAAPQIKPATQFTENSFTANWGKVEFADKYELTVYQEVAEGTDDFIMDEDFEKATSDGSSISGISESLILGSMEFSENEGADKSKCIIASNNNATIEFANNGGNMKECNLWIKVIQGTPESSHMTIETWDGIKWSEFNTVALRYFYDGTDNGYSVNIYTADPLYPVYGLRAKFGMIEEEGIKLCLDSLHYVTMPPAEHKFILENETVETTEKVIENLDPDGNYYYYVKSVNGDLSAISSPIYAFGLSKPVVKEATDIDRRGGYTANWEKTPKAVRYEVTNYAVFTSDKDMENYAVLSEDFSKIDSDATPDNPEFLNNDFEILNLDQYTSGIGWTGGGNTIAKGMLGFYYSMGYAHISTPPMTLNNDNGNFRVTITAYGYADDALMVEGSSSTGDYTGFKFISQDGSEAGFATQTLNFTGGSANEVLKFSSYNGYPIFIDEIIVEQNLKQGDRVFTTHSINNVDNGEENSTRFSGLDIEGIDYAYDVIAYTEKMGVECASQPSERMNVPFHKSISMETANTNIIYTDGKLYITLPEAEVVKVYDVLGRTVMTKECIEGENVFDFHGNGVYIVVAGDTTHKIIVK